MKKTALLLLFLALFLLSGVNSSAQVTDYCVGTCVDSPEECSERGGYYIGNLICYPTTTNQICCITSSGGPLPFYIRPLGDDKLINEIVDEVIDYVFKFALVLLPLIALWTGFLIATAAGNPEQTKTARKIITWAVIGFLVILFAKAISSVIGSIFNF